jgi:hypothetical protein
MSAWYVGLLVSGMGKVWLLLQPEGCAPLVAAWHFAALSCARKAKVGDVNVLTPLTS